jgi:RNA polymerase sigma-70 factor (ECF subfamily)
MKTNLNQQEALQSLMNWRTRVSAAAWVVVRDTHAAEDIFQNVALKAMTREVVFESESALLSWAFITARREGLDWLRRHRKEALGMDEQILELLEREWQAEPVRAAGARIEALQDCYGKVSGAAREHLRLRYYEGCSCEEAAERTGLGLTAVYKRLSRLHLSLKECVEGRLNAPEPPAMEGAS